jgi:hypothetical protein
VRWVPSSENGRLMSSRQVRQTRPYAGSTRGYRQASSRFATHLVITSWRREALSGPWVVVTWPGVVVAGSSAGLGAAAVTVVLAPQGGKALLLGVGVDVGANDKADNVEEGHPRRLGQELLGKGERDGRDDPADLHDGPEAGLDRGTHLVKGAGTGDDGHGDEVYRVLDGRHLRESATEVHFQDTSAYNQVADEDLHNLGLETLAPAEHLLQDADEDVAERGADEGAVDGHLGHARREVVALLAPVVGDPRGEELLQAGEGARGEHLGAQRVLLELLQVGLRRARQYAASTAAN